MKTVRGEIKKLPEEPGALDGAMKDYFSSAVKYTK